MPYDWGTQWPGVLERHADRCPFSDGETCRCGPLGYVASIADPDSGEQVSSPMLSSSDEARTWRREQEWAVSPQRAARNGSGAGARLARRGWDDVPAAPAPVGRTTRRTTPRDEPGVSELVERFLDAAEDGEARGPDGRPYSDDELAELEWALTGYVATKLGDLSASAVRGRHAFQLIDELEDAGMPPSRLRAVVGALSALFDYASELGFVQVNPAAYVALPAEDRQPRQRLRETLETRLPRMQRPERPERDRGSSFGESVISERTIWMLVKIVTLIFICIALVLAAESV